MFPYRLRKDIENITSSYGLFYISAIKDVIGASDRYGWTKSQYFSLSIAPLDRRVRKNAATRRLVNEMQEESKEAYNQSCVSSGPSGPADWKILRSEFLHRPNEDVLCM